MGLVQAGHRLAIIALIGLLGAAGLAFAGREFYAALGLSFGAADLGICTAVAALSLRPLVGSLLRETRGVIRLNAALAGFALIIMLVARAGVIQEDVRQAGQSVRGGVTSFFSPPPALPPQ